MQGLLVLNTCVISSGVATGGGAMGAVHPGCTFWGGAAKLRLYLKLKVWKGEKYFEGEKFRKGLQKSGR